MIEKSRKQNDGSSSNNTKRASHVLRVEGLQPRDYRGRQPAAACIIDTGGSSCTSTPKLRMRNAQMLTWGFEGSTIVAARGQTHSMPPGHVKQQEKTTQLANPRCMTRVRRILRTNRFPSSPRWSMSPMKLHVRLPADASPQTRPLWTGP